MLTQESLRQFNGSAAYHRWSILFKNCVLTDGVLHVAESGGAYWLMDLIASHVKELAMSNPRLNEIQFWKLEKVGKGCKVSCSIDDGFAPSYEEKIPYTDFPLESVDIWVSPTYNKKGEKVWVFYLPSEH